MQKKEAECVYCNQNILIPLKSSARKAKCSSCWKVWHTMRTKYQYFSKNTTTDDLVLWWINSKHECVMCGTDKKLTTDRIKPGNKGGLYSLNNIQKLCYRCNCCIKWADNAKNYTEKTCRECEKTKPLTTDYWHKLPYKPKYKKNSLSMYHSVCAECRRQYYRDQYNKSHK